MLGPIGARISQNRDRSECSRLHQIERKERLETTSRQIGERRQRSNDEAQDQDCAQGLQPIAGGPGGSGRDEAQGCSGGENDPELLRFEASAR
jgi:hypothetical protein